MIPLSMDETITHKDDDGTVWKLVPRTGLLEREALLGVVSTGSSESVPAEQKMNTLDSFIDKIVVGVSVASGKSKSFPKDGKASDIFNTAEKWQIFNMWLSAGTMSVEEKKS